MSASSSSPFERLPPGAGVVIALGVGLCAGALYWPALEFPYLFDDKALFEVLELRAGIIPAMLDTPFRAVTYATYGLDFQLFGFDFIGGMHLTNIVLHAAVVALAFAFTRMVTKSLEVSVVASLFLAAHPFLSEGVLLVSARADLLLTAGWLAALMLTYRIFGDENIRRGHVLALAVVMGATFFTKENAIMAPAALFIWGAAVAGLRASDHTRHRRVWVAAILLGGAAVAMFYARLALTPDPGEELRRLPPVYHWTTQPAMWWRTAKALLWPHHLSVYPQIRPILGVADPRFAIGLTGTALGVAAVASVWRVHRCAAALIIACAVTMLPAAVLPLTNIGSEHRLYPVAAGVCIAAAWLLPRAIPADTLRRAVTGVLIVCYGALTVTQIPVWRSEWALWKNAHFTSPGELTPATNLAHAALGEKRYRLAGRLASLVVTREPQNVTARVIRANALRNLGQYDQAMGEIQAAQAWRRRDGLLIAFEGLLWTDFKNYGKAREKFERALELDPTLLKAHVNLAMLYKEQGRLDDARRQLEQARRLNPREARVHMRLAEIALEMNDIREARAALAEAQRLNPALPGIYAVRAGIALQHQDWEAAAAAYRTVLTLDPANENAANGLGGVLIQGKRYREAVGVFARCEQMCPTCITCSNNRGIAHYELNEYALALEAYKRALARGGDSGAIYNGMANALRELGRLDEAMTYYDKALEREPERGLYHYNRAIAYYRLGDTHAALRGFVSCMRVTGDPRLRETCSDAYSQLAVTP